jgi:hypothetical protein
MTPPMTLHPYTSFLKMAKALAATLKSVTELKGDSHTCISLTRFQRKSYKNGNHLQLGEPKTAYRNIFLYIHLNPFNITNEISCF